MFLTLAFFFFLVRRRWNCSFCELVISKDSAPSVMLLNGELRIFNVSVKILYYDILNLITNSYEVLMNMRFVIEF